MPKITTISTATMNAVLAQRFFAISCSCADFQSSESPLPVHHRSPCGFLFRPRNRHHGRFCHLDPQIVRRNAQVNKVLSQRDHGAPNAPTRHNAVACLEFAYHLLPLLLPPLVRQNQKEVEDRKDENQRKKEKYAAALAAALKNE